MNWLVIFAIIAILIGLNALYVAGEFATVSARRSRLAQMAKAQHNRAARMLLPYLEDVQKLDLYVAACQIGITVSSLVLGFYGQASLASALTPVFASLGALSIAAAESLAATIVLASLTILQVVLGELVPKNIGLQYPERLALFTIRPVTWSLLLFAPLIWLFNGSGRLILRLLGVPAAAAHAHIHAPEEILMLVEESGAGGMLDQEEQRLLKNTLRLRALTVRQVMIPRNRMVAAPADTDSQGLLRLLAESPYSRLPLYEDSIDHIVGFVHLKDLFCLERQQTAASGRAVMRDVPYSFEAQPVRDVFVMLQHAGSSMAIVLDEFGGTAGMVTLEDVIEAIFGDLRDEFDTERPAIQVQADNRVLVRGDMLIADLNERLALSLEHSKVNTIGGLILSKIGRLPQEQEELVLDNAVLRVERMSGNSVDMVSLDIAPATARQLQEEQR
jgi:CBS domain containing-hemolysin-like protein